MAERKAITERQKINALLYRNEITCAICKERILPDDALDWDHVHSLCLGGEHHYTNFRPLHKQCHKWKTRQDVKDNAKWKRLAGVTRRGNKKTIRSRPMQKRHDPWGKQYRENRT